MGKRCLPPPLFRPRYSSYTNFTRADGNQGRKPWRVEPIITWSILTYHVKRARLLSGQMFGYTSTGKRSKINLIILDLPNVYFFNAACSMCIQNLRGMIVNNSFNVNETDVKVHSLKELTDFNEPMVAVSSSLRQAKVCKFLRQLPTCSRFKCLFLVALLFCYFRLKENSSIQGFLREINSTKTS